MREIKYTVLGDGSSDKALLPIIEWTIRQHEPDIILQKAWADFSLLPKPPASNQLSDRINRALDLYPCEWLFIHRDAEKETIEKRNEEIKASWQTSKYWSTNIQIIKVIPVRMTEAWLLINEQAIRIAAGNPRGKTKLSLPAITALENLTDPKNTLKELLKEASELQGRKLQNFKQKLSFSVQLVAVNIDDFSPLRKLPAFRAFEEEIKILLEAR